MTAAANCAAAATGRPVSYPAWDASPDLAAVAALARPAQLPKHEVISNLVHVQDLPPIRRSEGNTAADPGSPHGTGCSASRRTPQASSSALLAAAWRR